MKPTRASSSRASTGFVYVKGVKDLTEALQNAESVRGQVSTVGLAAPEDKAQALATELARWGVTRVCRARPDAGAPAGLAPRWPARRWATW